MFTTVSTDLPLYPYPCAEPDCDPYEDQGDPIYWETGVRQVLTESDRAAFPALIARLKQPAQHWRRCIRPSTERILLALLTLMAGGWCSVRASYRKLGLITDLDPSTVQRRLQDAEEIGLVTHVQHGHPEHYNSSNEWMLLLPTDEQMGYRRLDRERRAQRAFRAEAFPDLWKTDADPACSEPSPPVGNEHHVRHFAQPTSDDSLSLPLIEAVDMWTKEDAQEEKAAEEAICDSGVASDQAVETSAVEAETLRYWGQSPIRQLSPTAQPTSREDRDSWNERLAPTDPTQSKPRRFEMKDWFDDNSE